MKILRAYNYALGQKAPMIIDIKFHIFKNLTQNFDRHRNKVTFSVMKLVLLSEFQK